MADLQGGTSQKKPQHFLSLDIIDPKSSITSQQMSPLNHQMGASIVTTPNNNNNMNHSKLNIKSRENSLLANIKKLDEEYREMKKPFVDGKKKSGGVEDVVFYSGVGYKKVVR